MWPPPPWPPPWPPPRAASARLVKRNTRGIVRRILKLFRIVVMAASGFEIQGESAVSRGRGQRPTQALQGREIRPPAHPIGLASAFQSLRALVAKPVPGPVRRPAPSGSVILTRL